MAKILKTVGMVLLIAIATLFITIGFFESKAKVKIQLPIVERVGGDGVNEVTRLFELLNKYPEIAHNYLTHTDT